MHTAEGGTHIPHVLFFWLLGRAWGRDGGCSEGRCRRLVVEWGRERNGQGERERGVRRDIGSGIFTYVWFGE
jgi:hypothetical protein